MFSAVGTEARVGIVPRFRTQGLPFEIYSHGRVTWRCMTMVKSGLACCAFTMVVLVTLAAQNQPNEGKNNPVTLKYLGAAGWEITDGTTSILIDPYLSRINGPP